MKFLIELFVANKWKDMIRATSKICQIFLSIVGITCFAVEVLLSLLVLQLNTCHSNKFGNFKH